MDKNVVISLKGIQTNIDGQTNTMEMMSEGKFYKKDNTYYIIYRESEITGLEGTTTTLKVAGSVVSLIRFGTLSSTLIFEQGKKHFANYGTAHGDFDVAIEASEVRVRLNEDGGELYVEYEVEISGERLGYNNFDLKVFPMNNNETE